MFGVCEPLSECEREREREEERERERGRERGREGERERRQILTKRSRNRVVAEDAEDRLSHAQSLVVQGQLHYLTDSDGASVWADVVQGLSTST